MAQVKIALPSQIGSAQVPSKFCGHVLAQPAASIPRGTGKTASNEAVGNVAALFGGAVLGLCRAPHHCNGKRRQQTWLSSCKSAQMLQLKQLGGTPFEKALFVNLDANFYGSFAEIGAGQEVSRTFLTAGAAASTVGRSVSAYDMQMSDASYGKAKRYVTRERCYQMMNTEYDLLQECVRETRGADVRFFSLATTLAARAYMSTRECEGWVGMTFQHQAGAIEKSTVCLHVRMSDPTAQEQGEAIGVLGTNLVYLCHGSSDPYIISSFLLDGIRPGRLEVDYISFQGPAFPEGTFDYRLLALRMVQFGVADGVLLEYDEGTGRYMLSVPNTALYKRPTVLSRSYFRPVTNMRREVLEAGVRKLSAAGDQDTKPAMPILNMQVDDIATPVKFTETKTRLSLIQRFMDVDTDGDGMLDREELKAVLPEEDADKLLSILDANKTGRTPIDSLTALDRTSTIAKEFMDRFNMLEPLKYPVLVSSILQMCELADYLRRYTNQTIAFVTGGDATSVDMLFDPSKFTDVAMLTAWSRMSQNKVQVFEHPYIKPDGTVAPPMAPSGNASFLHEYLMKEGQISHIEEQFLSPSVLDSSSNEGLRGGSADVRASIQAGTRDWERMVPEEVAKIMRKRNWFQKLVEGQPLTPPEVFDILKKL